MNAPIPHPIPDNEWIEHLTSRGKSKNVMAYTWGNDDGSPNGEDHIVLKESDFKAVLAGNPSRAIKRRIVHELGHNFDKDRNSFDRVYDHPHIDTEGLWAAIKDAVLVKKFGTMSAIEQLQWFAKPKHIWAIYDDVVTEWRNYTY